MTQTRRTLIAALGLAPVGTALGAGAFVKPPEEPGDVRLGYQAWCNNRCAAALERLASEIRGGSVEVEKLQVFSTVEHDSIADLHEVKISLLYKPEILKGVEMEKSKAAVYASAVTEVVLVVLTEEAKSATKYISPKEVVRATQPGYEAAGGKPLVDEQRQRNIVLTLGRPNYREAEYIKDLKKAGEPFPVKRVQLKHFPEKKRKGRTAK